MARFRKSGTNWEGRTWVLAPGMVVLATQIETKWPDPEPGDGTVASKNHDQNSPNSDHRPAPHDDWTDAIVRAIDSGETSEQVTQELVDALVASRDPRIMYLIYEGKSIWAVTHNGFPAWTWQPYGGTNPHEGHFHLSSKRTATADNDTRPWDIGVDTPGGGDLLPLNKDSSPEDIGWLQDLLNHDPRAPIISVTRTWDAATISAVKTKAGSLGLTNDQKNGLEVNYRQWNQIYSYFVKKVDLQNPDNSGGGLTEAQVLALIEQHADNPDAHHE